MIFPNPDQPAQRLVLASGSRYRKALLDQLGLTYAVCSPDIDEAPIGGEMPTETVARLARQKARAVAECFPASLIIGADQVATVDGMVAFSKPETHANAVAQLTQMSGCSVAFHTAVCLLNSRTGVEHEALVSTDVRFRALSADVIETYLQRDRPYDCAGSAKIESLGVALVHRVTSDDPTALLGLPLIALIDLLATEGILVP